MFLCLTLNYIKMKVLALISTCILTLLAVGKYKVECRASLDDYTSGRQIFTVSTILAHPYTALFQDGKLEGFVPDIVNELCRMVDIRCEIKLVKDGKYGQIESDGSWNGMVGEVVRGEVDMAAGPLMVSSLRMRVVSFLYPYQTSRLALIHHESSRHSDFNGIFNDPDAKFLILAGGFTENHIRRTNNFALRSIMTARDREFVKSTIEGIERVRNENNTYFLIMDTFGSYYEQQSPCDLKVTELPRYMGEFHYAFAVPLNHPLEEHLNLAMAEMQETERIGRLYEKWWFDNGVCAVHK